MFYFAINSEIKTSFYIVEIISEFIKIILKANFFCELFLIGATLTNPNAPPPTL